MLSIAEFRLSADVGEKISRKGAKPQRVIETCSAKKHCDFLRAFAALREICFSPK
jgi:hypothetical protein